MTVEYKINQDVVNPARPEWGIGKVLAVEPVPGGRAQRVRVRFPGAGVKNLMIPPGRLTPPDARVDEAPKNEESPDAEMAGAARLCEMPQVISDRRAGLDARIEALVTLYRFADDPRDVFDWAVLKLGQKDPLSLFSADELTAHYQSFCRRRDWACKELYRETVRAGMEEQFNRLLERMAGGEIRDRIRIILAQK